MGEGENGFLSKDNFSLERIVAGSNSMPHKRTTPLTFHRAKALRRAMTPPERKLWSRLRNHQLERFGFRRQHAIGQFITDFCCPQAKLVIEVDGDTHANQIEYDEARTEWLNTRGWRVLRFTNREVEYAIDAVAKVILEALPPLNNTDREQ